MYKNIIMFLHIYVYMLICLTVNNYAIWQLKKQKNDQN